ncbi:hypothetical protein JCM3765_001763 [Sporobolomyces pararoseus]
MSEVNPTGQWKESLSLEETNKVRISLGLKPLKDPNPPSGPTEEERILQGDELAEFNFRKRQEKERREREEKELGDRLERARNQKERGKKLRGVTLGGLAAGEEQDEGEGDEGDTKAWLKRQKKRAKELALKRAKEQEEMDKLAQQEELERSEKYGEKDLKGIKVSHGAEQFEEGEEHVLTLKDSKILDDEDDELHNLNLTENAKHKAAVDLKKKGRQAGQYTGYDDEEFNQDGAVAAKRGVLSKYDEGFEGVKEDGFKLGQQVESKKKGATSNRDDNGIGGSGEREKVKLSMDYTKSFSTDYLQEGDAGFKKPKMKKKKRPARTTTISTSSLNNNNNNDDEESTLTNMQIDSDSTKPSVPPPPRPQIERTSLDSSNLIDDDDLAVSLARQRREAAKRQIKEMKERAKLQVEESVNQSIKSEEPEDEDVKPEVNNNGNDDKKKKNAKDEEEEEEVLVMDDTSEFVRNIKSAVEEAASKPIKKVKVERKGNGGEPDMRGLESVQPRIKQEEGLGDEIPLSEMQVGGWNAASTRDEDEEDLTMRNLDERPREEGEEEEDDEKPKVPKSNNDDDEEFGTTGEKLVSKGLASTLSILRHQGLMKPRTAEEIRKEKEFKEREAWLVAQRRRDEERERERIESRNAGDKKDQRQREYENKLRDQRDAQAAMEAYKNYKPVVELKYHDEFGRDMTPKEAWKHLSHSFHGHGHGSKKTEKRLQKIENERKAAAMAAGDTPNSTAAAFAARAAATGSATMILGVGNNNSAPLQKSDESLSLSKKTTGKGKGKATTSNGGHSANTPVFDDIPMRPLPLPSASSTSRDLSATPEPSTSTQKKGFAPVRSFSPATESGGGAGSESAPKFAPISVAVKRKATEQGEGSPASKRRA